MAVGGPVAVVAVAGLLVCAATDRSRSQRILLVVLGAALLFVPLEQARIHTTTSLDKHLDIGAWFAAIAAGYAVSVVSRLRVPAAVRTRIPAPVRTHMTALVSMGFPTLVRVTVTAAAVAGLAIPLLTGFVQARALFQWPNSRSFVDAFRPLAEHSTGPLLVEAPSPVRYYLARRSAGSAGQAPGRSRCLMVIASARTALRTRVYQAYIPAGSPRATLGSSH